MSTFSFGDLSSDWLQFGGWNWNKFLVLQDEALEEKDTLNAYGRAEFTGRLRKRFVLVLDCLVSICLLHENRNRKLHCSQQPVDRFQTLSFALWHVFVLVAVSSRVQRENGRSLQPATLRDQRKEAERNRSCRHLFRHCADCGEFAQSTKNIHYFPFCCFHTFASISNCCKIPFLDVTVNETVQTENNLSFFFRPSTSVSRIGLLESRLRHRCCCHWCGGPPPLWLATPQSYTWWSRQPYGVMSELVWLTPPCLA